MLQKKECFFNFNNPEVIEERNKLIAERIGRELRYNGTKIRDLCNNIDVLSQDPTPRRLREYLYEKLWAAKSDISREGVQKIITTCHEEAFDRLQKAYPDLWNIWVAIGDGDHVG